jgi:iron complex transport system substrate-binding protein
MRVVSLVPAATEIAAAIGALDDLVAVTHDCDHPPSVRGLPRVTRSTIPAGSDSATIDAAVREAADRGESTFHLDGHALRVSAPDVVLGQTLCRVCAVTLEQASSEWHRSGDVVPLEASSIEGILDDIIRVADALQRPRAGASLVAELRSRLRGIEAAVAGSPRSRVACLEWLAPPFNAGHWVPEQVRSAGAEDVLGAAGARSRVVSWAELSAGAPDWIFIMLCGLDAERAAREARALLGSAEWDSLPAVKSRRVYALDGNAYFSRPGPRVIDGTQLLASIVHPDRVQAPPGAAAIRVDQG